MGRRLKHRFELHDKEMNGYLGISAVIFLLLLCLAPWALEALQVPNWVQRVGITLWGILMLIGFFSWYHILAICIGKKYNLLCVQCGSPLRRAMAQVDHPDHRKDGEVAKRCPRCHVEIGRATKK